MKTGILSMQRVNNYGSFFLALSLKNILEELGNTVEFIDIKPGKIYKGKEFTDRGEKNWDNREFVQFRENRNKIITQYAKKYLGLQDEKNFKNDYDFAIIGSDEVFNCIGNGNIGFTPQLFGENVSHYTITYAASCGHTDYDQIKQYNLQDNIKNAVNDLKNISVRDDNTKEFIEKITNRKVLKNVDPVFIYNFDRYIPKMSIQEKDYIIIYSYDYRLCDKDEVTAIKKFAKDNKLEIIGLGLYQPWCDRNINVTPFELLQYFKNASYVITDTFHGAVFSIKYNKKFAGISRQSNNYKFNDLLKTFHLENRKLVDINDLEDIIKQEIDYESINNFIKEQTDISREYLKCELEKAQKMTRS